MDVKKKSNEVMDMINSIMPYYNSENSETGEARFGDRSGLYNKNASFSILALRCDDELCTGKKNLRVDCLYQLLQGYHILDEKIEVEKWRHIQNLLYDDYYEENANNVPHVQFSAIVGKNGSGKSTIIELIMRIINNFATIVYGEINHDPASKRLRYIENVMATMWFSMNNYIYMLRVNRHQVSLIQYCQTTDHNNVVIYGGKKIIINEGDESPLSNGSIVHSKNHNSEIKKILQHFFYTLVSNYSIYAYNPNDYLLESVSSKKLEEVGDKGQSLGIEEGSWLHSLFHKNDGYKVPLGLTPYRTEGNIDINKGKELAHEHFISLLIKNKKYRVVNGHVKASGLSSMLLYIKRYDYMSVKNELGFTNLTEQSFKKLHNAIIANWVKFVGVDFVKNNTREFYSDAIDYIVYKTLKISKQYNEHHEFYKVHNSSDAFTPDAIEELVRGESNNHSHVTRKVYQTIAYLLYNVYDLSKKRGEVETVFIPFEGLYDRWQKHAVKGNIDKSLTRNACHIILSALMPPPFIDFRLEMISLVPNNRGINETVLFESLSSGERQQVYTISSILYHLDNLNTIKTDEYYEDRVFYPNVNIILEEIELYFHPEMQQKFVRDLLDGINSINLENVNSINFILVTHSPYVLSDIPRTNILAMSDNAVAVTTDKIKGFGANIYEMLRTSFFLTNGALGLFAQWEIKHIKACIDIHEWVKGGDADFYDYAQRFDSEAYEFMKRYTTVSPERNKRYFEYDWFNEELGQKVLKTKIDLIDEPILRSSLLNSYYNVFGFTDQDKEEKKARTITST